ncbi:MAG: hypothetical protein ACRCUS_07835, partial [Anaerovoracaceae bacterium]
LKSPVNLVNLGNVVFDERNINQKFILNILSDSGGSMLGIQPSNYEPALLKYEAQKAVVIDLIAILSIIICYAAVSLIIFDILFNKNRDEITVSIINGQSSAVIKKIFLLSLGASILSILLYAFMNNLLQDIWKLFLPFIVIEVVLCSSLINTANKKVMTILKKGEL